MILMQGVTGKGKTLLGLEFIYRKDGPVQQPGLILVFETCPDKLMRDAAGFGWNLGELQQKKTLQIILTSPQVHNQEMRSPDSPLLETAVEMGARRIFIDGVGLLGIGLGGSTSVGDGYCEVLQQLMESLNRNHLIAMLSLETDGAPDSIASVEMTDSLADTVIQLGCDRHGQYMQHSLEVIKSRGQEYEAGEPTLRINADDGLEAFRPVQAPLRASSTHPTPSTMRLVIGVAAVDILIDGGIFDGSTTMVVGVSGVGKTALGTEILREGALRQKARGFPISLDEHPAQIVHNAQTLGLSLDRQVADGTIQILFESPQESDVAYYAHIIRFVEEQDTKRMLIDGMTSCSIAIGDVGVYRDFFHAMVAYGKQRSITTFFNYENPESLRISSCIPDFPVSSIVDNLILLSLVETNNSLHCCISVFKSGASKHSLDSRELVIGPGRVSLVPVKENLAPAARLQSYSLFGRAPTTVSLSERINCSAAVQDKE